MQPREQRHNSLPALTTWQGSMLASSYDEHTFPWSGQQPSRDPFSDTLEDVDSSMDIQSLLQFNVGQDFLEQKISLDDNFLEELQLRQDDVTPMQEQPVQLLFEQTPFSAAEAAQPCYPLWEETYPTSFEIPTSSQQASVDSQLPQSLPFPTALGTEKLDIVAQSASLIEWQYTGAQTQPLTSQPVQNGTETNKLVQSPFSASSVQSVSTGRKNSWQPPSSNSGHVGGREGHSAFPLEDLLTRSSIGLPSRLSSPSPLMRYDSSMLGQRSSQRLPPLSTKAHSATLGGNTDPATLREEALLQEQLARSASLRARSAHLATRSASTPVQGVDVAKAVSKKPMKRTKKAPAILAEKGQILEPSLSGTLLQWANSKAHSIRVVSGKGEFDFPSRKSSGNRGRCLTIRSNDLDRILKAEATSSRSADTRTNASPTGSETTLPNTEGHANYGDSGLGEVRRSSRRATVGELLPTAERRGSCSLAPEVFVR